MAYVVWKSVNEQGPYAYLYESGGKPGLGQHLRRPVLDCQGHRGFRQEPAGLRGLHYSENCETLCLLCCLCGGGFTRPRRVLLRVVTRCCVEGR